MDGTFLRPDSTFDRPRLAMLRRRMREDGVRFVVASGNQEAQLLGFFEDEEDVVVLAPDAVQSENGSILRVGEARLLESSVDEATLCPLISVLEDADAFLAASGMLLSLRDHRDHDQLTAEEL